MPKAKRRVKVHPDHHDGYAHVVIPAQDEIIDDLKARLRNMGEALERATIVRHSAEVIDKLHAEELAKVRQDYQATLEDRQKACEALTAELDRANVRESGLHRRIWNLRVLIHHMSQYMGEEIRP